MDKSNKKFVLDTNRFMKRNKIKNGQIFDMERSIDSNAPSYIIHINENGFFLLKLST